MTLLSNKVRIRRMIDNVLLGTPANNAVWEQGIPNKFRDKMWTKSQCSLCGASETQLMGSRMNIEPGEFQNVAQS